MISVSESEDVIRNLWNMYNVTFKKIIHSFAKSFTIEFWRGPKYAPKFTNSSRGAALFRLKKDKKPWKIYKLRDTNQMLRNI